MASTTPHATSQRPRIILADSDLTTRSWLGPRIGTRLGAELMEMTSGLELERALTQRGADLVITNAQLLGATGLQVLAKLRARGVRTPFIVFSAVQGNLMRVFISDGQGTVLSSRVISSESVADLAQSMMRLEARLH